MYVFLQYHLKHYVLIYKNCGKKNQNNNNTLFHLFIFVKSQSGFSGHKRFNPIVVSLITLSFSILGTNDSTEYSCLAQGHTDSNC